MDKAKLGWTVKVGSTEGIFGKIDHGHDRFSVGEKEFPGAMWDFAEFIKPPARRVFIGRSATVSLALSAAEHDTLVRAGAFRIGHRDQ